MRLDSSRTVYAGFTQNKLQQNHNERTRLPVSSATVRVRNVFFKSFLDYSEDLWHGGIRYIRLWLPRKYFRSFLGIC